MACVTTTIFASEKVINIKESGAVGNGIADDSKAIRKAVAIINKNHSGQLFFPKGTYLFKGRGPAMLFRGVSDTTVKFEPGAVLLIDNLRKDGRGNGHGILFKDAGKNITLEDITVKWKEKPKHRSHGDGIRFDGYPANNKTISNITMLNCRVINSPQAGAIFHGCSDITVKNFRPEHTRADGLHFNACRRVKVKGVAGVDNGDDTLAMVTYYHPTKIGAYREFNPPYNQPVIGDWNNTDSTASDISVNGGRANGVRVSGGNNISIANIVVTGKGFAGMQIDSAKKTEKNRAVGWSYLASRDIKVKNLKVSECPVGFIIRTLNIKPDEPENMWRHKVSLSGISMSNCHKGIELLDSGDIEISEVESSSLISLRNARGKYILKNISLKNAGLYIDGVQGKDFQGWKGNREPKPFIALKDLSNLVNKEITIDNLKITNGMLRISDCAGIKVDNLSISNPEKYALGLYKSKDCAFDNVKIVSKQVPLHVSNVSNIILSNCVYGPAKDLMLAGARERKSFTLRNIKNDLTVQPGN